MVVLSQRRSEEEFDGSLNYLSVAPPFLQWLSKFQVKDGQVTEVDFLLTR